jgi:hypothetical protein
MTLLTSEATAHEPHPARSVSRVNRCTAVRAPAMKASGLPPERRFRDRDLDGSWPNAAQGDHPGIDLLAMITSPGLALFLTVGFVAGLSLNGGTILGGFISERACVLFFLWALALSACVTARRA